LFRRIKEAFKKFIDSASSIIFSREKLESLIEELKLELVASDVAYEVAEEIANKLLKAVDEGFVKSKEDLQSLLRNILVEVFEKAGRVDLVEIARVNKPSRIVFLGVNGVGKTTSIAKVAVFLREQGFKPLMVAGDTFRAGAQEQLKIHSERTGIPVFAGKYGADPASVAYDAIQFASSRGFDTLLIDTAGRMHVDIDLVNELKKVVRVVKPHLKVLVVDALTGNDAIEQARFFNEAVGVDGVIVTKVDAYEQGGVPLSIAFIIGKPIIYVGVGQEYKDLKPFNVYEYVNKILPDLES